MFQIQKSKVYGISRRIENYLKGETTKSIQCVLSAVSLAENRHAVNSVFLRSDVCPRRKEGRKEGSSFQRPL
jgi:hypothetical protein